MLSAGNCTRCTALPVAPQEEVRRAEWVTVTGLDRFGEATAVEGEGLLARVLQHEIDHLDGISFVARIEDPTRLWKADRLSVAAEKEAAHI